MQAKEFMNKLKDVFNQRPVCKINDQTVARVTDKGSLEVSMTTMNYAVAEQFSKWLAKVYPENCLHEVKCTCAECLDNIPF